MNISQAKDQIKNAVIAYFAKDEFGNYIIPIERQRPIFLMGPPGVGKTAIMEQIASELNVGLVTYSMTHHTRQSAIGLPCIVTKVYDGVEYKVSEYTMSEIIASMRNLMEVNKDIDEGILFIDEMNCMSETLYPAMLQFLQYKVFGGHKIPKGWIVVTAGNPPEYNNSVREFDTVTWDRLKRVDIEPSYEAWKGYASKKGIHPAITTYLDIRSHDFYKIESTPAGKAFVTARGWADLSDVIKIYEKENLPVDENLIRQYLQHKTIAKNFASYYDLFNKYKSDYQVDLIIAGKASEEIKDRAKAAKFDEKLALVGLITDTLTTKIRELSLKELALKEIVGCLKDIRTAIMFPDAQAKKIMSDRIFATKEKIEKGKLASTLSSDAEYALNAAVSFLEDMSAKVEVENFASINDFFLAIKKEFDDRKRKYDSLVPAVSKNLSNAFAFFSEVYGEEQEMLIFVTNLTVNFYCSAFIARHGCKEYFERNKDLLFYDRRKDIDLEIANLDLD